MVCRLKNSIYLLKFDEVVTAFGFNVNKVDRNVDVIEG